MPVALDLSSYVEYGAVRLHRIVTDEFRMEQVFDESGTDLLYQKYTIRVSGYLHGHVDWTYFTQIPGVPYGASAAHQAVRYQLPPRQSFKMVVGAAADGLPANNAAGRPIVLLEANPAPPNWIPPGNQYPTGNINLQNVDLNNGPRCTEFSVRHVTANEVFAVTATFEVCKLECYADGTCPLNRYGVLSNRWGVQDSLGDDMRCTRTYSGIMVLASASINAQLLRSLCAPPVAPGFRRDHMNFETTPDGLKLRWVMVDQEIHLSCPYPGRKWAWTHTEEVNSALVGTGSMQITVTGDTSANKGDLIQIGIYAISAKLFRRSPFEITKDNSTFFVESMSFVDHGGDSNSISVAARVRRPTTDVNSGIFSAIGELGKPITADKLPAPNDGSQGGLGGSLILDGNGVVTGLSDVGGGKTYEPSRSWGGYAGQIPAVEGPAKIVGIVACYLQNPCNDFHSVSSPTQVMPPNNQSSQSSTLSQQVPFDARIVSGISVSQSTLNSPSHMTAAYSSWHVNNVYKRRSMRIQMPIAKTPTSPYAATSAFVTLAGGQAYRILRVYAERVNADPEFFDPENIPLWPYPSPVPSGYIPIQQVYLTHKLLVHDYKYTATGQQIHCATMEIKIGLSRVPTAQERLALGNDKWNVVGQLMTSTTLTNSSW